MRFILIISLLFATNNLSFCQKTIPAVQSKYIDAVVSDTEVGYNIFIVLDVKTPNNKIKSLIILNHNLVQVFQKTRNWNGKEYIVELKKYLFTEKKLFLSKEEEKQIEGNLFLKNNCSNVNRMNIDTLKKQYFDGNHNLSDPSMSCVISSLFKKYFVIYQDDYSGQIRVGKLR